MTTQRSLREHVRVLFIYTCPERFDPIPSTFSTTPVSWCQSCVGLSPNLSILSFPENVTQVERGSLLERGATLVLVFLQLYPQYRALRIIFMRFLSFLGPNTCSGKV